MNYQRDGKLYRGHPAGFLLIALPLLLTSSISFAQAFVGGPETSVPKPNVLFIMTDTQRKDDMGVYGNPKIRTPNLDRLANEGVRFEQCYTQYPACMPSRAAIFTGRYPMANGVWSNGVPLPERELTLAEVFLNEGYRTGGFGKLHFLPHYPYRKAPPYRTMYREEEMPSAIRRDEELVNSRFQRLATSGSMAEHNQRVAYHRTQHYGEMTFIDDAVGKVIQALESLKIRKRTLIVFTSDHGDMLGDHWLWWKGPYHYAGCSNIPLLFNWPGHLREGKVVRGLAQHIDIFPTVLDLVGIDCPPGIQGRSQKSVLDSECTDTGYDYVYLESIHSGSHDPRFWNGEMTPPDPVDTFSIRSEKWRLTFVNNKEGELYDLEKDPDEFQNLWPDPLYEEEKRHLIDILLSRIAATRDPLPIRTKPY